MTPGHAHSVCNLINWDIQLFRQFLRRRFALMVLLKSLVCFQNLIERAYLIKRQTHDTRLLSEGLKDRLANPPYSIRDELETARFIEFLRCFDESEIAFVNKVRKTKSLILILFRNRNDEAQIRANQFLKRFAVSIAYSACQLNLLIYIDKGFSSNLLQVFIQRLRLTIGN